MKHTIRQHGQLTQIDCELGSGLKDKNGVEIIEGDIVKIPYEGAFSVCILDGGLFAIGDYDLMAISYLPLEVVGHVNDND